MLRTDRNANIVYNSQNKICLAKVKFPIALDLLSTLSGGISVLPKDNTVPRPLLLYIGNPHTWKDVIHDVVIKWKHFLNYWPFVRGIHRLPVNSPRKGQWRGALMFSLICSWINGWVNHRETGDLRRHRAYDIIVMSSKTAPCLIYSKQ